MAATERRHDGDCCGSELIATWGTWLEAMSWDHFATLTFAYQSSPEHAQSRFKQWIRRLEQRAQRRVDYFYFVERGAGGTVHIHAILLGTGGLSEKSISAAWMQGRSDISAYRVRGGAARYVVKAIATAESLYDIRLTHPSKKADTCPP